MTADEDIRIKILRELRNQKNSTAEFVANEFLSRVHHDLGTILRAVSELIDEGLVSESNVDWRQSDQRRNSAILLVDTKGISGGPEKDPKRLLNYKDIKPIRIFITLKGMKFLIQNEKLLVDLTISKWQRTWFWPIAFIGLAGLILSILSFFK